MTNNKKTVLENVDPGRREFMKNLLAGAAFTAPVIATFSIEALTANSAYAWGVNVTGGPNVFPNQCRSDAGYEGPQYFEAHVSNPATTSETHRINGQVHFSLSVVGGSLTQIAGVIRMVPGATITKADIMFAQVVLNLTLSGNAFTIFDSSLIRDALCDLDELADAMASSNVTIKVDGTYLGATFSVNGKIIPGNFEAA